MALAALSAMVACSHKAPPPPMLPLPQPSPMETTLWTPRDDPAGNACRERVAGLEDWLASIEQAGLPLSLSLLDEGAKLVSRPGVAILEPAPLVHVTAKEVYLDGIALAMPGGLHRELTALIELRRSMMPESPFIKAPVCYLAIDGDVAWERVVMAIGEAIASDVHRITFLFHDPERRVPEPPASPIDQELERMRHATLLRRQQIAAELMAFVYQDCPEGLRVIASMGANPVADFKQVLLDQLPDAIGACRCAADDASVKSLHWAIFGNPRPTSGVTVDLARPQLPPVHTVDLPEDRLWREAHAEVVAVAAEQASQPVYFNARPAEPHETKGEKKAK